MTGYHVLTPYHKKRRARFSESSPPKLVARLGKKPELIHTGAKLTQAQMRALYAVTDNQV